MGVTCYPVTVLITPWLRYRGTGTGTGTPVTQVTVNIGHPCIVAWLARAMPWPHDFHILQMAFGCVGLNFAIARHRCMRGGHSNVAWLARAWPHNFHILQIIGI